MKTAIITGASAGVGEEFVRQIKDVFPEIQCYWVIARRIDRLQALQVPVQAVRTAAASAVAADPSGRGWLRSCRLPDRPCPCP